MELSTAVWIDPLKLMQIWPVEESRLKVMTRPFELNVSVKILFIAILTFQHYSCYYFERFGSAFLVLPFLSYL